MIWWFVKVDSDCLHVFKHMESKFKINSSKVEDLYKKHTHRGFFLYIDYLNSASDHDFEHWRGATGLLLRLVNN